MRSISSWKLSPSLVISFIALFVAFSAGAFALSRGSVKSKHIAKKAVKSKNIGKRAVKPRHIKKRAIGSRHIRGGAVTGAKVADESLTGAKVARDSLTGEDINEAALEDQTLGRSGRGASCTPTTSAGLDCAEVTLTLPRPGRVLVSGEAGVEVSSGAEGFSVGCRLKVDDATAAFPHDTDRTVELEFSREVLTTSAVTAPLAAGAHTFELNCHTIGAGGPVFSSPTIVAVAIGSG